MKKNTIICVIVAILLAGAYVFLEKIDVVGLIKHTPSLPHPQEKLTRYHNTEYGYQITYPSTWEIQQTQEEERTTIAMSQEVDIYDRDLDGRIRISVIGESNEDLKTAAEKAWQTETVLKSKGLPNKSVEQIQESSLAGHAIYSYVVTGTMDGYGSDTVEYLVVNSGKAMLMVTFPPNSAEYKDVVSAITFN